MCRDELYAGPSSPEDEERKIIQEYNLMSYEEKLAVNRARRIREQAEAEEKKKKEEADRQERERKEADVRREKKRKEEAERREKERKEEADRQERERKEKADRQERERKEEAERRKKERKEKDERRERERKEEDERRERERLYKAVELLFEDNFLTSKQICFETLSSSVNEDMFKEFAAQFVINWFEKQGWDKPDQEQAMAIAEVWDDVQIIARAGSGKTSTTVHRAVFLVKHCKISPTEILLLAFNKKAAKEIEDRLVKKLGENAPQAMTFHALAYALVHPAEALIYDDENNGFKKSGTVQQVIDSFIHDSKCKKTIQSLMMKYFRSSWDEIENKGFHLSQEEMVEYRRSLLYLGFDGEYYKSKSEKKIANYLFEHNISYKYEWNFSWGGRNYRPDFTIPLSGNTKGLIIEYFGLAGDSEYDQQMEEKREFWKNKTDYRFIELLPNEKGSVDENELKNAIAKGFRETDGLEIRKLTELEIWSRIKDRAIDEFSKTIATFIGLCRNKKLTPENLCSKIESIHSQLTHSSGDNKSILELQFEFMEVATKIYQKYLETLLMKDEEDFEGLLTRAAKIVGEGQDCWNRKNGSGKLGNIKYLFIDEYQDFSLLFYELVDAIRHINCTVKVFCVGDDWQAINGYAGSDLCYFSDFMNYFRSAKGLTISSNYRSAQKIVGIGNRFMHGKGMPSKSLSDDLGDVQVAWVDDFKPNNMEYWFYHGEVITPMLIRLVYSYIQRGQRVALLCRRGNKLPWYTSHRAIKGIFHSDFIKVIRDALPEEMRSMVVAMATTHSYKGKEEDAIIVVDAVRGSYPLLHPSNIFYEAIGQSTVEIIQEEKRLFYVALSRAKKSLVIVTEHNEKSPFLNDILHILDPICLEELTIPPREGRSYILSITNDHSTQGTGTYPIKEQLLTNRYIWNANQSSWIKIIPKTEFTRESLLEESWVQEARNILITVVDEFENELDQIHIDDEGVIL